MDAISRLLRLARLQGSIDRRSLRAGDAPLDVPAAPATAPLYLLSAGEVMIELADRDITVTPGDVVVLPRGQAHRLHASAESAEIDLFAGHYDYSPGAGELLFNSLPDPVHVSFDTRACEPMRLLSTLMLAEAQEDGPGTEAVLYALCDALLAMVLRSAPGRRLNGAKLWTAVEDERMYNAMCAVIDDPGHRWTIPELAGRSCMSRAAFIRHFGNSTGVTVGDFLGRVRMMVAADLLAGSEKTIGEIATDVGYQSVSAFGRNFRAATGSSPARFRRETRA
ncbi:MAG TPA: AraC family transcriptional regulator [Conexibacter sp.]|jgi:AraC family transcriptional activator of mtrCDE